MSNVLDGYSFSLTGAASRVNVNGTGTSNGTTKDEWLPTPAKVYVIDASSGSNTSCTSAENSN